LPEAKNFADEGDGVVVGAEIVGVGDPARQDERVVVTDVGVADGAVGREGLGLVEVVEGLDLAGFGGEQVGFGAGCLDSPQRLGQLDFLDPFVGHQECDPLPLQLVRHRSPPHPADRPSKFG
jgi:hypothetical protein